MACRTCELLKRRDRGEAPMWDSVARTEYWDLVHCDRGAVEGWMILVVRRHVPAVADLSEAEAAALGPLVHRVSLALTELLGCESTYVVNFAEHPQHRHVHVHVIARPHDLEPEFRGPGVFQLLNVEASLDVSEDRKNELALQLRPLLTDVTEPNPQLSAAEACRLEMRLLEPAVRADRRLVDELLHSDFAEFGSSGRFWDRDAIAEALAAEPSGERPEVRDLKAVEVSPGAFLVTYRTLTGERDVLRSSLWVVDNDRLHVRWHQGTPTAT